MQTWRYSLRDDTLRRQAILAVEGQGERLSSLQLDVFYALGGGRTMGGDTDHGLGRCS